MQCYVLYGAANNRISKALICSVPSLPYESLRNPRLGATFDPEKTA
jgi:hypothetical protein